MNFRMCTWFGGRNGNVFQAGPAVVNFWNVRIFQPWSEVVNFTICTWFGDRKVLSPE